MAPGANSSHIDYEANKSPSRLHDEPMETNKQLKKSTCMSIVTNPTFMILCGAVLGLVIGIAISDGRASDDVVTWIALFGDLFLRALKCVVLPLVFVNIILAVIEMMDVGKAVTIGWKTVFMYTLTTAMAALEGLICVLLFKPLFSVKEVEAKNASAVVRLQCPSNPSLFISEAVNGSLVCASSTSDNSSEFLFNDVKGSFNIASSGPENDISFSQTMQDGIFRKMVPANIFEDLVDANFVGVICFAIVLAVASQLRPSRRNGANSGKKMKLVELLEELNEIFLVLINGVIYLTAPAVVSLIAGALGQRSDLGKVFADIGVLMAATLIAMFFHALIVYPAIFYMTVHANPFNYMRQLAPAQMFAFASASSAATLPVTMKSVSDTNEVPDSIANFVLSLGSTINMDGGAIYFSTAIVFLAVSSGLGDKLDFVSYFLIILLSTVGSAGTAPVPSASLVLIITAFNTVFDTTGTPETFSYILAIDWFMDRCRTLVNVTGDAVMARVITAMTDSETMEITDPARLSQVSEAIDNRLSYKRSIFEVSQ